jgi:hypothetical protein
MMGREYLTAAGYVTSDGDTICVNCGDKRKLPVAAQITLAAAADQAEDAGLWCDSCGATIVEPEPEFDDESEFERDYEGGDIDTD